MYYHVQEASLGAKNLQKALDDIAKAGGKVVSVVTDHGGTFLGVFGSGATLGYLIVSQWPGER